MPGLLAQGLHGTDIPRPAGRWSSPAYLKAGKRRLCCGRIGPLPPYGRYEVFAAPVTLPKNIYAMSTVKEVTPRRYGTLWAAAYRRPEGALALKNAVRCVCEACGAHSYRVIGSAGVTDHCSVCGSYALVRLSGPHVEGSPSRQPTAA